MEHPLTEASQRVLHLAQFHAEFDDAQVVEPRHLLLALLRVESYCSELLVGEHKVTWEPAAEFSDGEVSDQVARGAGSAMPFSPEVEQALFEARRFRAQSGRHGEVGTEHLLWGLMVADEETSRFLASFDVTREELEAHLPAVSDAETEPIPVDEELHRTEPSPASQIDTLRILDAATNRAGEGLRVVEDFARFVLGDDFTSRFCKRLRHELAELSRRYLPRDSRLAARDTEADVGTQQTSRGESVRHSPSDIAAANLRRAQEAARTIEEFTKLVSADYATAIKAWRYRLYTLEKALAANLTSRTRLTDRNLYLLLTADLCSLGWEQTLREALAGGVSIVQVREKMMSDRRLIDYLHRVREIVHSADALLLVNDRPDIAVVVHADGVHLGQDDLDVRAARRILGPDSVIGVSTHSLDQIRDAILAGADYLGIGPVFPSGTKQFEQLAGLAYVRQAADETNLPWFAIGGVTTANVSEVVAAGGTRVAVSGAICQADQPGQVAKELTDLLRSA